MVFFGLTRLNPLTFVLLALVLVFTASFLMWHLVEKRFLTASSHYRRAPANAGNTVTVPG